jgi:hypothetical protein
VFHHLRVLCVNFATLAVKIFNRKIAKKDRSKAQFADKTRTSR